MLEVTEQQLAGLSPEQRQLVERWLRQQQAVQAAEPADDPARRIGRRPDPSAYPLSFGQQRLWLVDQMEPGSSFYNITSAVRLLGPLDIVALRRCIGEIMRRHESLRTTFAANEGQPVEVIAAPALPPLPLANLSALPLEEREPRGLRMVNQEARRPFDLARGPLARALLLRLSPHDHILLLSMHHIVSDGWSVGVVLRELGALYPAFAMGQPSPLSDLPIQYADYAYWQRHWLEAAGDHDESPLQRQMAYWRQRLGGGTPPLDLPTDRPRMPSHAFTTQGAKLPLWLPKILVDALVNMGRQDNATLYMVLLAALQTLLHRYTGQDLLTIGSPIANRNRDDLENMIGFFNNILVMRGDLSGDPPFRALLRQAREATLGAYANQDVPFEKLVEELQPPRLLGYPPLFQVMLGLQNQHTPLPTIKKAGITLQPLKVDTGTARFDLALTLGEMTHGLTGSLRYKTDLFDAETIERMAGHFQNLLEGIIANPDARLSDLPLLSEAERRQILDEWSASPEVRDQESGVRDQDLVLHELVAAQAARAPDAVAISFDAPPKDEGASFVGRRLSSIQLTYAELDRRAGKLASRLRALGAGPGAPVGVVFERSPGLAVALLGALKARAAYVPLDPNAAPERTEAILGACGACVVVTNGAEPRSEVGGRQAVDLGRDWEEIAAACDAGPLAPPAPDQPASIAQGDAGGAAVAIPLPHRAVAGMLAELRRIVGLAPGDAVISLLAAPDLAGLDLLLPLTAGARLALSVPGAPAASGASALLAMPADLQRLLDAGWAGDARMAVVCGAPAAPALVARLRERVAALWRMYGHAACAGWSIALSDGDAAPDGRPLGDARIYILDRWMQPAPTGVPGELYVGGPALAQGFLGRPDLTAARFLPNPFAPSGSMPASAERRPATGDRRLYKTGDLARWRPGGLIELVAPPQPEQAEVEQELAFVAPRTPIEEALAGIWSAVIGRERIGVHDDFFHLGGHSLNAALLVSRVRETFQVNLPLRSLFEATTVTAMAQLIVANESRPGQTEKIALMLKRLKSMSPEDRQRALELKRKARERA